MMNRRVMSRTPNLPNRRPFVRPLTITHLLFLLLKYLVDVRALDASKIGPHFDTGVGVARLSSVVRPLHELGGVIESVSVVDQSGGDSVVEFKEARICSHSRPYLVPSARPRPDCFNLATAN